MTNWLITAQQENEIPDATDATEPQTATAEEILNNDQEVQEMKQWFQTVVAANEFVPEAKKILQEKLRSLGFTDDSQLPAEITSLFE